MCKLCVKYGVDPIEDTEVLSTAIAETARAMELQPSSSMHYLDFLDNVLDGKDPEDLNPEPDPDFSDEDAI